jgi:uncharacterized protein
MSELEFRGQLEKMDRKECLALIATKSVGRLAFTVGRWAEVVPVNHVLVAGEIVVRVTPSGQTARYLHENGPDPAVTYEVDSIDEATESGWSVVIRGTARATPPEILLTEKDPPVPWPSGSYWDYVRIHPVGVTGRRLVHS